MWAKLLLAGVLIGISDALMCYQCSDTSGDEGRRPCQSYVRTMRHYRKKFEESRKIYPGKYVKDCEDYGNLPNDQVFCSVTTVEGQGSMKSFIRGCSDGNLFFESDFNEKFASAVIPDNQTTCIYDGQGYIACVTMCETDFCNGPLSSTGRPLPQLPVVVAGLVTALMLMLMLKRH